MRSFRGEEDRSRDQHSRGLARLSIARVMSAGLFLVSTLGSFQPAAAATTFCKAEFCKRTPPCPESPPAALSGPTVDLCGQTLTNVNYADNPPGYLVSANFSNTTLIGVNFSGVNLRNANFSGAQIQANQDGVRTDFTNAVLEGTRFTGANLSGADLQFARLKETDFTCATLLDAKFGPFVTFEGDTDHRTKFNYSKVGIARSADSYLFPLDRMSASKTQSSFWSKTDFTCTSFEGMNTTNFRPAGRSMIGAILRGAVLDGFEFYDQVTSRGVNLDGADLSGISLQGADLRSASMDGVTLVGADLTHANLTEARFFKTRGSDLTRAVLNGSSLAKADLREATLSGARLNQVYAAGATFDRSTMQATAADNVASVINSDFSGATFANAALNNVTFSRSRLNGADMALVTLSGTSFQDSIMVGAVFGGATLQDVNFTGAQLNNASFVGANLSAQKTGAGVNFTCAQLGGADFSSVTLGKANFDAAVMPPDSQCCPQVGGGFFCGRAVDGTVYGHTTLPASAQTTSVTCPNGTTGNCSDGDWEIPGWKTTLCGDGREQVVWRRPDCGGQPFETVKFDDPKLEACVQEALIDRDRQPVTKQAAAALEFLNCPGRGISNLEGLTKDNFPALKTLDLSANHLTGMGDFGGFSENLQTIKLSDNDYTSLVFSNRQQQLNYLDASNNRITSVKVSPNTYLSYIDLDHNQLAGTQDFFAQKDNGVQYLDLSFNNISSIGNAGVLKQARTIYLQNNQLTTIGSVEKLWASGDGTLFYLSLDGNACFQCGTLGVDKSALKLFGCACDPHACTVCD